MKEKVMRPVVLFNGDLRRRARKVVNARGVREIS